MSVVVLDGGHEAQIEEIDATVFGDAGWKGTVAGLASLPEVAFEDPKVVARSAHLATLVFRVSIDGDLAGFHWTEVRDWLAAAGARDVVAFAVFELRDAYFLYVSEHVRDATGSVIVDFALDRPVTAPRVVPLGAANWPASLDRYAPTDGRRYLAKSGPGGGS